MEEILEDTEISQFYQWIREYWAELSMSPACELSHFLNFGVWQADTENLYDAQEIFRRNVINALGQLDKEQKGLEVGCGIGGFAVKLVREKHVNLVCLDMLKEHLELSSEYAQEENVADKIEFQLGNSMMMSSLEDNSFDFAYCLESSFHYSNKPQFFNEIYRVLRPGSTFVIADITCNDNSKITFKQGNYFPSTEEFRTYMETAGFKIINHEKVGLQIFKPLLEYLKEYNRQKHLRNKLTKYWERVLINYAELCEQSLMDYEIVQLYRP
jgi:ubiquinone/menaquinone biosynthesis C-methylase UbiE